MLRRCRHHSSFTPGLEILQWRRSVTTTQHLSAGHGHGHSDDHSSCGVREKYSWELEHHHHAEPEYEVPTDHTVYRLEEAPLLVKHVNKMRLMGLDDPWARQYVFMYNRGYCPNYSRKWWRIMFDTYAGYKLYAGILIAIGLIIFEKVWLNDKLKKHWEHSTCSDVEHPKHDDIRHH